MIGQLTQDINLCAFESDFTGKWKPSGIFVRMQEIAEDHAKAMGCGYKTLVSQTGMVWMLTRMHLQMNYYPKIKDDIILRTWHGQVERLIFPRYFSFETPQGEQIGCATSDWVLFHVGERKLMRPSALTIPYQADTSLKPPARPPLRIRQPKDMQLLEKRRVRYSDIDMNMHMNNAKYTDWICDLFDTDMLSSHALSELDITYTAEASIDQTIDLKMAEINGRFYVVGETQGKNIFSSAGIWKD